jgi:NAD(P)-dependent dehydrogenase (short-subunit alcohol dehydrogenase family)
VRNDVADADPERCSPTSTPRWSATSAASRRSRRTCAASGYGRIVNIGGLTGRSSHALSGMRNLAVVHMTKALVRPARAGRDHGQHRAPGVVETEHIHELYAQERGREGITPEQVEQNFVARTPIRRVLSAEEVADAVCFLASPRSGGITGESLGIDGGLTRGIFL